MPFEGSIIEIPAGRAGINAHKNPRRVSVGELIDAEGAIFEDGILQKERGAAAFDSAGISGSVKVTATLGVANKYTGMISTLSGGTPAYVGVIDTEVGPAAAQTTFDFDVGVGGVAGTDSIVLSVGGINVPLSLTAADTSSNTYTNQGHRQQRLSTNTDTLATESTAKDYGAVRQRLDVKAVCTAAAPLTALVSGQLASGTTVTAALGSVISIGGTLLLFVAHDALFVPPASVTATLDVTGVGFTELANENIRSDELTFTAKHVTTLAYYNCPNLKSADTITINFTRTVSALYQAALVDTANIVAAPTVVTETGYGAGTTVTCTEGSALSDGTAALDIAAIGAAAKTSAMTLTNGTGWTTLNTLSHTTADLQLRVVYATRYFIMLQQLVANNITALSNGDAITVTASEACFMYGAAHQIDDGTAVDQFVRGNSGGTGTTTSVSVGPTGALTTVPECAVGAVCVNDKAADCTYTDTSSFTVASTVTDATNDTQIVVSYFDITSTPTILGLWDWWPTDTTQRIISVCADGIVYKETSGNLDAVQLQTGWSTAGTNRPRFVPAGKETSGETRKLFIFPGLNLPKYLAADGATLSAITVALDWSSDANAPINGVFHNGRVWAFGNVNWPHHVYASAPGDHTDWTGTDAVDFEMPAAIGERLYCGAVYQGILVLWAFPRGIFWLDDTDPDYLAWKWRFKSSGIGCASSPHAALPLDDDVMFMDAAGGFHLLSAVDSLSGTVTSSLSRRMNLDPWIRENVNLGRLSQLVSVWYPHKQLAIWALPATGSTTNNLTLYFDFSAVHEGGLPKFSYSLRDDTGALAVRRDTDTIQRPIMGEQGSVYQLDQDTKTKASVGYAFDVQGPHSDWQEIDPTLGPRQKQFVWLEYLFDTDSGSTGDLTVEVYVDGTLATTLTFDSSQVRQRKRIAAQGYTLSLREYDNTGDLTADPRIITRYVGFTRDQDDPRT